MTTIDRGSGPPLVLIPGLQGRWEYMRPAVDALSAWFRVITFSLQGADLDALVQQAVAALDRAEIERATICGVSFGGLVALRFAARQPARCGALVLASTPRPALQLRIEHGKIEESVMLHPAAGLQLRDVENPDLGLQGRFLHQRIVDIQRAGANS